MLHNKKNRSLPLWPVPLNMEFTQFPKSDEVNLFFFPFASFWIFKNFINPLKSNKNFFPRNEKEIFSSNFYLLSRRMKSNWREYDYDDVEILRGTKQSKHSVRGSSWTSRWQRKLDVHITKISSHQSKHVAMLDLSWQWQLLSHLSR